MSEPTPDATPEDAVAPEDVPESAGETPPDGDAPAESTEPTLEQQLAERTLDLQRTQAEQAPAAGDDAPAGDTGSASADEDVIDAEVVDDEDDKK